MRRWGNLLLCVGFGLLAAGCPKGKPDFTQGKKAEALQDYDAAFNFYQKVGFDTSGQVGGLAVVYDPDFRARRITVDLVNVTLEQALEIVSLDSKAFVNPVTENIIFVIPDQPPKRRDYEEQVVKTFYISNTIQPQDLTEIVTGLRQLLDLKRIQQLNSQNAIIVRDTPDKLLLAEKMIHDIDKAKPEVVVQAEVLEESTDRLPDLGILP